MNGNDIFSNLQQESKKIENRKGNLHYFDWDLLFYLLRNDYCVCVLMLDISWYIVGVCVCLCARVYSVE